MKKLVIAASALVTGTALFAQGVPVATPAPASPVRPMQDKVMTRAEAVQMVRRHFGKMDADQNGIVTTAELDGMRTRLRKEFRGGRDMRMRDPNAAFDRLDDNKDGAISREEFGQAREERVERRIERREKRAEAGSPRDGKRMRRHVMRMHGPGRFAGRMIGMADTNRDGMVSMAEAEALTLQYFDGMDSNKDGQVTREERRAGRRLMIERKAEEKSGN